jgi:hypothetical protein
MRLLEIERYCPFLLCQRKGPHTHSVCPVCGAVRYGNLFCEECKRVRTTTNLIAVEDGREEPEFGARV